MWNEPVFVAPVKEPDEPDENPVEFGFELPCFRKAGDIQNQMFAWVITNNALRVLNTDEKAYKKACEKSSLKNRFNIYFTAKSDGVKDLLREMGIYFTGDENYLLNCLDELVYWKKQKENQNG